MVRITTKTGDQNETSLWTGQRVAKTSDRIIVIGKIDSLIAYLGICRFYSRGLDICIDIALIQRHLSEACSEIGSKSPDRILITREYVHFLEERSKTVEAQVKYPEDWFYAGIQESSSQLNYARALSRECEIGVLKLSEFSGRSINLYFNRLSDYLYLAMLYESQRTSRQANKENQEPEQ